MSEANRTFTIGTRGSALALWQANRFREFVGAPNEIKIIKTSGDKLLDIPLQGKLEKGFFTKEIEERLISKEIDFAVHSLKDLPTETPEGLAVGACLERAEVEDLLIVKKEHIKEGGALPLKSGCKVGAGSLRRQALIRLYAPDVKAELIRGNVPTRIGKLRGGFYDAMLMAKAALVRLGIKLNEFEVYELNREYWLPAPAQGAVAIEARSEDQEAMAVLSEINHKETEVAVNIERRLLANFEGGCHTAFGAYARREGDRWRVTLGLQNEAGKWLQTEIFGSPEECSALGIADLSRLKELNPKDVGEICRKILL